MPPPPRLMPPPPPPPRKPPPPPPRRASAMSGSSIRIAATTQLKSTVCRTVRPERDVAVAGVMSVSSRGVGGGRVGRRGRERRTGERDLARALRRRERERRG